MADKENEFTLETEDDLEILPDGWGEGDDFFNVDSWGKGASADESKDGDASQDLSDAFEESTEDGTTTADEEVSEDSAEAEEPTTQDGEGKLKFKATVDHEDLDVELDETELPSLYQKAQVTERVQAKLANMQPIYDRALRTAKILGYDTPEEMLKAAEDSFRDGEVERLVNEGTQKDVAEDYVRRKMQDAEAKEDTKQDAKDTPKQRDFKAEVEALLEIRPELKVPGTKLPEEVTEECVKTGKPLAVAYLEYEARQEKARYDKLLKENNKLKQNAEAASRAPVRGVSRGGPVKDKANDDPFLAGFNADD